MALAALDRKPHPASGWVFTLVLLCGLAFAAFNVAGDVRTAGEAIAAGTVYILALALFIALAFEFVNGFHDTANAVATVIYTHSMPPLVAVIWSGLWNFIGVVLSTGAVAYGIVALLPIEATMQGGSHVGYAMIFAMLIAAIIWNLGTWALGVPNSSSHALVGSILGVGVANQLMAPPGAAVSSVDWNQAFKIGQALVVSPIVGFLGAGALLLIMKATIRDKTLYQEPQSEAPPPWWIRLTLIGACTGVSFAHGSNDGQKGMGLIMLILLGSAPTAYALNHAMGEDGTRALIVAEQKARAVFIAHARSAAPPGDVATARRDLAGAAGARALNTPHAYAALAAVSADVEARLAAARAVARVPAAQTPDLRGEITQTSDAIKTLAKTRSALSAPELKAVNAYRTALDGCTHFIPPWVKLAVAVALGLGTVVGWKRIVITVGQRIGRSHMTYAQGAAASIVAALTIGAADQFGLPVSTTHVLSSGVAGTMAANGSGLQWRTVRVIASAWTLTVPGSMALAAVLFFVLRQLV